MKNNYKILTLAGIILVSSGNQAFANGIYNNNISALNINMLTDTFMSYTNYGTKMYDLFNRSKFYGTMGRFDEYGDDGTTNTGGPQHKNSDFAIDDVWVNANYINGNLHYKNQDTQRGRFNLASFGGTTADIDLLYGKMSFGGFATYLNNNAYKMKSVGNAVGIFAKYSYELTDMTLLIDSGTINNRAETSTDFHNMWVNTAAGLSTIFRIDNSFLVRPNAYFSYTFVSSDKFSVNNQEILSTNFNFMNIAPEIQFIKEITPFWYGMFSVKYIAHLNNHKDIRVADKTFDALKLNNHTDIGIDVEHKIDRFLLGIGAHKQMGGFDGWSGNINVKYAF